jgi:hypothetical protein
MAVQIASDNFTDTDFVDMSVHVPDTGLGSWVGYGPYLAAFFVHGNALRCTGNAIWIRGGTIMKHDNLMQKVDMKFPNGYQGAGLNKQGVSFLQVGAPSAETFQTGVFVYVTLTSTTQCKVSAILFDDAGGTVEGPVDIVTGVAFVDTVGIRFSSVLAGQTVFVYSEAFGGGTSTLLGSYAFAHTLPHDNAHAFVGLFGEGVNFGDTYLDNYSVWDTLPVLKVTPPPRPPRGAEVLGASANLLLPTPPEKYSKQDQDVMRRMIESAFKTGMQAVLQTDQVDFNKQVFVSASDKAFFMDKAVVVAKAALATNATDGFLYIPGTTGTPTGTPANYGGHPMIYDTGANKLWVWNGSAWKWVALT